MKSVITCDMEGVIETINPDGEKLFGYSREELIGKKEYLYFQQVRLLFKTLACGCLKQTKKASILPEHIS